MYNNYFQNQSYSNSFYEPTNIPIQNPLYQSQVQVYLSPSYNHHFKDFKIKKNKFVENPEDKKNIKIQNKNLQKPFNCCQYTIVDQTGKCYEYMFNSNQFYYLNELDYFSEESNDENNDEKIEFILENDKKIMNIPKNTYFQTMYKMKNKINILIDRPLSFVVFTQVYNQNMWILIEIESMDRNDYVIKFKRTYYFNFPMMLNPTSNTFFITNKEFYCIDNNNESTGTPVHIPSSPNLLIEFDHNQGYFSASTTKNDSCYLLLMGNIKLPVFSGDELEFLKLGCNLKGKIVFINNNSNSFQINSKNVNKNEKIIDINKELIQQNHQNTVTNTNKLKNKNQQIIDNNNKDVQQNLKIIDINNNKLIPEEDENVNDNDIKQNEKNNQQEEKIKSLKIQNFNSYNKLIAFKKKERINLKEMCRYCDFSNKAIYFIHGDCKNHKPNQEPKCIECRHIICQECSGNHKICFMDNKPITNLVRI